MVDLIETSYDDIEDDGAIEEDDEMESVEDSVKGDSDTTSDGGEDIEGSDSNDIYYDSETGNDSTSGDEEDEEEMGEIRYNSSSGSMGDDMSDNSSDVIESVGESGSKKYHTSDKMGNVEKNREGVSYDDVEVVGELQ